MSQLGECGRAGRLSTEGQLQFGFGHKKMYGFYLIGQLNLIGKASVYNRPCLLEVDGAGCPQTSAFGDRQNVQMRKITKK